MKMDSKLKPENKGTEWKPDIFGESLGGMGSKGKICSPKFLNLINSS